MQLKIKSRYFNTVGSKEGWTPSTFVSSRNNRSKDGNGDHIKRPEDFMDEEDLADAAELQRLQTQDSFASLGRTVDESIDLLYSSSTNLKNDRVGNKLLYRMGWRDGQGIGPKVFRKARLNEDANGDVNETASHYFAPEDTQMVTFNSKNDTKGLGFRNDELSLNAITPTDDNELFAGNLISNKNISKKAKTKPYPVGGFGIGILNQSGSDEEDPYEIGPRISYNKTVTSNSRKKSKQKQNNIHPSANPLVAKAPMFQSKKGNARSSQIRSRCHDGQPPVDGFKLADLYEARPLAENIPLPRVPPAWRPSKITTKENQSYVLGPMQPAQGGSLHDPKTRAAALGETALPGKSVFDYISSGNRDRIADVSQKSDLPAGLGQLPNLSNRRTGNLESRKDLSAYYVTKEVAVGALHRSMLRGMPYSDDIEKLKRYRSFLQSSAGLISDTNGLPSELQKSTVQNEHQEFAQTAKVFQPISSMMATRFTSSSAMPEKSVDQLQLEPMSSERPSLDSNADSAEAAAKSGMYGTMTRSTLDFYPTRLVCKRFGVQQPIHVQNEVEYENNQGKFSSRANAKSQLAPMTAGRGEKKENDTTVMAAQTFSSKDNGVEKYPESREAALNLEMNAALESERAGDELFNSIFGTDDI